MNKAKIGKPQKTLRGKEIKKEKRVNVSTTPHTFQPPVTHSCLIFFFLDLIVVGAVSLVEVRQRVRQALGKNCVVVVCERVHETACRGKRGCQVCVCVCVSE